MWQHLCEAHGLKVRLIPWDVIMHWNSTHDMMVFALKYWRPIDSITVDKSLKMQKYELDNKGWSIIEQLVSVLQVSTTYSHQALLTSTICSTSQQYKLATLYFSQDSASIAGVIPAMDTLTSTLNPEIRLPYYPLILAAMELAKRKMNRYYLLMDDTPPYRIAMGKFSYYLKYRQNLTSFT